MIRREDEDMSTKDDNKAGLVPSQSCALSRSGATSLIRRGRQDLIAKAEADQWLKKGQDFAAQQRHEEAFASFERGIELNPTHPELLCSLADAYHMGYGVQENDVQAMALYRQAAEQGDVEGQVSLGWIAATGAGVPVDNVEAIKWWRLAAEQGNEEAQFLLAFSYEEGLGVPKDRQQAVHWYRKAADQGEESSREALDRILNK